MVDYNRVTRYPQYPDFLQDVDHVRPGGVDGCFVPEIRGKLVFQIDIADLVGPYACDSRTKCAE